MHIYFYYGNFIMPGFCIVQTQGSGQRKSHSPSPYSHLLSPQKKKPGRADEDQNFLIGKCSLLKNGKTTNLA